MSQTPEQNLLSKLYECQEEIESYINKISVDENFLDLHYKTAMTVLSAKNGVDNLIDKLETVICNKQELM